MALDTPILNKFVPGKTVLEALGLVPDGRTSRPTRCPTCANITMRMTIDPIGGNRFYCTHCRMNCDAIQLFSIGKKISLRQAVADLSTRVSLPNNAVRYLFPKWKRDISDPMSGLIRYLEKGRKDLVRKDDGAWGEMLRSTRIFMGTDASTIRRTVANCLSGVTKPELLAAMSPWKLAIGSSKQYRYVVLPFCDVYNRPRSLMLFDRSGRSWLTQLPLWELTEDLGRVRDGGLCFLDQLEREEEVVFAVGDIRAALQLKIHHSFHTLSNLPIVGYTPFTGRSSWSQVRAKSVIFWTPKLDVELFRQVRYVKNAFVATMPNYSLWNNQKVYETLVGFQVDTWRKRVKESAIPWQRALVDWLLGLPEIEALEAVETLDLTATEAEELLDGLDAQTEVQMVELFGISRQVQSVVVENRQITQTDGKWVEVSRMGPKLISDVTIYLDRVQHPMSGGEETIVGFISKEGTILPFHEKLDEVQNNTIGWLTRTLLDNGQALPQIAPVWSRRLCRIAQAFHNPKTVQCVDRVGYVEGVGMVFPRFTVKEGRFLSNDQEISLLDSAIPGQEVESPQLPVNVPMETFDDNPVSIAAWTMISFMLSNMEAQRFGAETKGILVYAPDVDDAQYVAVNGLARSLHLPIYEYTDDMNLLTMDRGHVLPMVVDARNLPVDHMTLFQYLFDPNPKSLMLIVSDLSPWKESSLAGWLTMAGQRSPLAKFPFDRVPDILFSGLQWLHRTMDKRSSMMSLNMLQKGITECVKCSGSVPADNLSTIVNKVKRSSGGDVNWHTVDSDRSLIPLFYMYDQKGNEVKETEGIVTIPAGALLTQFRKLTGCLVRLDQITYALRRAGMLRGIPGNSIEIDVGDWHSNLGLYRSLMPPEGLCL